LEVNDGEDARVVNDGVSGGEGRRRCCSLPSVDEERRRLFPVVEVVSDGFPVVEVVSDGFPVVEVVSDGF
jgi:hypothetical protein